MGQLTDVQLATIDVLMHGDRTAEPPTEGLNHKINTLIRLRNAVVDGVVVNDELGSTRPDPWSDVVRVRDKMTGTATEIVTLLRP